MEHYENESQIKKALDIDSWRNLSKEKLLSFIAEMPKMDKEVALKVIEQFPNFKELALGAFMMVKEHALTATQYGWKSQKRTFRIIERYQMTLERELEREGLTTEDRFALLSLMKEAVEVALKKDSEWKAHTLKVLGTVGSLAALLVLTGITALGGKSSIGGGTQQR